jgi:general stress protein 26
MYVVKMTSTDEQFETISKIIKGAQVAMVTTVSEEGQLVSRPLALPDRPFDGELWFFTEDPSPKTDQLRVNDQVNVSLSSGDDYISLAGTGSVSKDRTMIESLWNKHAEAWFENGIDDPSVAMLRFRAESAEYWKIDAPKVVAAVKYAKALVTGEQPDIADNQVVDLNRAPGQNRP